MSTKLLRLGYTEFHLVFANFLDKYIEQNNLTQFHIQRIRSTYVDWIYKTAGYYDKDTAIKDNYLYPDDFTAKLDTFIDSMGDILYRFDEAAALPLDSLSDPANPLSPYIEPFEKHYNIKLHPYNIDARRALSVIRDKKKILVISSFKELIDQQITNGNFQHLHHDLAQSEFITYKSPYTFLNNGPHKDSFETLDTIKQDLMKNYTDFDIAILACGCYGAFLTDFICNSMNKNAAYVGGQLPLIFGIIGQRDKWALRELYPKKLDYVIDGVPDEYKPAGYSKIESGCYW